MHNGSLQQGIATRAVYGWVSHVEPSCELKMDLMTVVFFFPLALQKYCQSGVRCYSKIAAGVVMKQQLSIENNFNENRRSFIDQELKCAGWAGIAEEQQSGEEMTKYTLVLQLSAVLVIPHHWRREICLGEEKSAKSVTLVEVFQTLIFRTG